jgi:hypothetical protein
MVLEQTSQAKPSSLLHLLLQFEVARSVPNRARAGSPDILLGPLQCVGVKKGLCSGGGDLSLSSSSAPHHHHVAQERTKDLVGWRDQRLVRWNNKIPQGDRLDPQMGDPFEQYCL